MPASRLLDRKIFEYSTPELDTLKAELAFISGCHQNDYTAHSYYNYFVQCYYPYGSGTKKAKYAIKHVPTEGILLSTLQKHAGTEFWQMMDELALIRGETADLYGKSKVLVFLSGFIPNFPVSKPARTTQHDRRTNIIVQRRKNWG